MIKLSCGCRKEESWDSVGSSLCNMDPTKIILENVGRNFNGNYSCQVFACNGLQFRFQLEWWMLIF